MKHEKQKRLSVSSTGRADHQVTIFNMKIMFIQSIPVWFARGHDVYRLARMDAVALGMTWEAYSGIALLELSGPSRPLCRKEFEVALYDNLVMASRELGGTYDVCMDVRHHTQILLMVADQLETICNNEWSNPKLMRAAIQDTRVFLLERLSKLVKADNESVDSTTQTRINTRALRDAIANARVFPTNGLPEEET